MKDIAEIVFENDDQFKDHVIEKVSTESSGMHVITFDGGWCLGCGEDCAVTPEVGQTVRIYGRGIGAAVRGRETELMK